MGGRNRLIERHSVAMHAGKCLKTNPAIIMLAALGEGMRSHLHISDNVSMRSTSMLGCSMADQRLCRENGHIYEIQMRLELGTEIYIATIGQYLTNILRY